MLWTRGDSKGCMQPPVKCVSYIVILRNALLVENLDLIPGYRCSEQQDAAEFLNGVISISYNMPKRYVACWFMDTRPEGA